MEAIIIKNEIGSLNGLLQAPTLDIEEIRKGYRRLITRFPSNCALWYSWMQLEWRLGNYSFLEGLFGEALRPYGDVRMWRLYLQYVRMGSDLSADGKIKTVDDGTPNDISIRRQTVIKAYELALSAVGVDLHSSSLYIDYIAFLLSFTSSTISGNHNSGSITTTATTATTNAGTTMSLYEQQQQMDAVRKVYNRALTTPLDEIERIWHDYDAWENQLNKMTAKKILADRSAAYMAARQASKELAIILAPLDCTAYAMAPNNDEDEDLEEALATIATEDEQAENDEFTINHNANSQYQRWKRWIEWEQANPLKHPEKSPVLQQRVQYAYRTTLSVLRLYPEVWFDYSKWLIEASRREEAELILKQAIEVLPVDLLVNFAYADLLEQEASKDEQTDGVISEKQHAVLKVHDELVERLIIKVESITQSDQKNDQSKKSNISDCTNRLVEDLTLAIIQQMHCHRRVEGIVGARVVFTKARKLTIPLGWQLYVSSALMEYYCRKDATVAGKIFELGMGKFGSQPAYLVAYLQHLLGINDETNARALFERALRNLTTSTDGGESGDVMAGLLEVWRVYLEHHFKYGDGASIRNLVQRFRDTFAGHHLLLASAQLPLFLRQYSWPHTDPNGSLLVNPGRLWKAEETHEDETDVGSRAEESPLTDRLPKPFCIPESVWELQLRLPPPDTYTGPLISGEGLVRVLMILRIDGGEKLGKSLAPTGRMMNRMGKSKPSSTNLMMKRGKVMDDHLIPALRRRTKREDLSDEGGLTSTETTRLTETYRADDLFAQRHGGRL